jgi:hypothetical protein
MIEPNANIIYIRAYNGSLIPISRVQLVTTDPNTGDVVQEVPMLDIIEKLMHHNMNYFEKTERSWKKIEEYDMLQKVPK